MNNNVRENGQITGKTPGGPLTHFISKIEHKNHQFPQPLHNICLILITLSNQGIVKSKRSLRTF